MNRSGEIFSISPDDSVVSFLILDSNIYVTSENDLTSFTENRGESLALQGGEDVNGMGWSYFSPTMSLEP